MKKRVLSLLMALALCIGLLPVGAGALGAEKDYYVDKFDANGEAKDTNIRTGLAYGDTDNKDNVSFTDNKVYVIEKSMTFTGNLTIGGEGGLVLCKGVTLTVEGALIHEGGNKFYIYGKSNDGANTGTLVIENNNGDGAAIRSTAGTAPRLGISSGELKVYGGNSNKLVDNVVLYSSQPAHMAIRDKNVLLPSEWSGSQNTSISGSELVIEYCDHSEGYVTYTRYGDTQHYMTCEKCGFNTDASSRKYAYCGDSGAVGYVSDGANGHYQKCPCGNKFGASLPHDGTGYVLTDGNKKHIAGCIACGWTSGGEGEAHDYDEVYGACKVCAFQPILEGAKGADGTGGNLYDDLETAIEAGETELTLVSYTADKVVASALEFDFDTVAPITLNMGDCKLTSTRSPALTVSKGALTVKGDAEISQTATSPESVSSAISVTGGELIFEGNLTATGGSSSSKAASAIEVSGGTVTFKGTVNATGGLLGQSGNAMTCEPAIKATNSGELDFGEGDTQVELTLWGGLTVTGDATLTHLLTRGNFYQKPADSKESVTANVVSVVGAKNYKSLSDLLADGYVFFAKDGKRYLVFGDTDWSGDTTIVAHEHTWAPASGDNYECSVCGKACAHKDGYETGKCEVCGKPCPHYVADQSPIDHKYYCNDCGEKMAVQNTKGDRNDWANFKYAYFTNLKDAMAAAEDGWTVTLLDDVDNTNKRACVTGDGKTVTLNLNGHTVREGWIQAGYENWGDQTSSTLKIIGSGSFMNTGIYGSLSVGYKATLDLSGWTGGTISKVNPSKKDGDESTLIVGEKAGTIENLNISSWPTDTNSNITYINKTKLSGGSYNNITITMNSPGGATKYIPFSSMLEEGYAFQYVESGEFVDYAAKAEYGNGGGSISNVKVVKCPHAKVEHTTCVYCNKTGIAATVDGTIYDDVDDAIDAWLNGDGTLKLFTNGKTYTNGNDPDLSSAPAESLTIDLNGYSFNQGGGEIKLGGKTLTITDSSSEGKGVFGPVLADSGTLVLESGTLEKLTVHSGSTAQITLKGGQVNCISYPLPIYNLLGEGCYLLKGDTPVEPTETLDYNPITYTVKKASVSASPASLKSVEMGENRVPLSLTAFVSEDDVTQVQFRWYLLKENGTTARLIQSDVQALDSGWGTPCATYDGNYTYSNSSEDVGWNDLNVGGPYDLVLVVTGKDADGENKWHTAFTGYQMSLTAANLENAEITFTKGGNHPSRATFNPFGPTEVPPYTVTCYGRTLTLGADYTVVSGNTASDGIGYKTLTIRAVDGSNYTGTKTERWEVEEYILSAPVFPSVTKQYDGTTTMPDTFVPSAFTSRDTSETRTIPFDSSDYSISDAHYITPDAGDNKAIYYQITLRNNYRFGNGDTLPDCNESWPLSVNASITKADAPTVTKTGALTIVNGLEASYTADLTELLPTLKEPCEYGEITYGKTEFTTYGLAEGESYGAFTSVSEDGVLTFRLLTSSGLKTGKIGAVTIPVTTTNYEGFSLTVEISAVNKPQPTVTAAAEPDTIIYGTKLEDVALKATATHEGNNVSGTIAWSDPSTLLTAGDHEVKWTFRPDDTDHYRAVSGTVRIHVDKATPTGEPKYTAIEVSGKKLSDAALAVNESWPAGSVKWVNANGEELAADTVVKPNTAYRWIFTPEDGNNYNAIEGSITLYHYSVDIPDAPTYPVNVPDDTANGSVSISPKNAPKGSTVTITVKPDSGYQLGDLIVTDKDGNVLEITDKGDGKYTFVMPNGTVNVRGSFVAKTEESPFRDVSTGAYYYDAVKWAVGKDITSGIGNGLFGPNQSCTRAQIVTFLWRAAGSPEPAALSSFTDVAPTAYYAKAVAWAVENGVTTGTSATEFSPNEPCTRAQAVTFLYRALKAAASGSSTAFSDVAADAYYASAVAWAVENGVTTGVGGGLFAPKDTCTRAQIVTFLYRAYQGK